MESKSAMAICPALLGSVWHDETGANGVSGMAVV